VAEHARGHIIYSSGNVLLDSLPAADLEALRPSLRLHRLTAGQILCAGQGLEEIESVHFPVTAVTSMAAVLSDGDHVEALPVGFEGLAGFQVIFGSARMFEQWICAVPGLVASMRVDDFWKQLNGSPQFGRIMLCYSQSLITMLAISVACNSKHTITSRCAKWLLLTLDRAGRDEFEMTHEFLAMMLGVRRAGVSNAAAGLQRAHLIRYRRGSIRVLDRAGLERMSCECYANITQEYWRLMAHSSKERFIRTAVDSLS
jgi:hypothetical protein